MKTHPTVQTFGSLAVALRVPWLEAKGDPLSRLDTVIDWEGFRPLLVQSPGQTGQRSGRASGPRPGEAVQAAGGAALLQLVG